MTIHTLVLATNNANKIREIQGLLADTEITVMGYKDAGFAPTEVDETGESFEENARLKVAPFPARENTVILAEDSGIEVDALDGRPGIYSARYAGPNPTRESLCQKLLSELEGTANRGAQYRAVMALKFPDDSILTTEGICRGNIAKEMSGENGFGYDPIFIPQGHHDTFGVLDTATKEALSHRAQAIHQTIKEIQRR